MNRIVEVVCLDERRYVCCFGSDFLCLFRFLGAAKSSRHRCFFSTLVFDGMLCLLLQKRASWVFFIVHHGRWVCPREGPRQKSERETHRSGYEQSSRAKESFDFFSLLTVKESDEHDFVNAATFVSV